MDTKLKNYSSYKGINVLVFVLCVVFFVGALTLGGFTAVNLWEYSDRAGMPIDDVIYGPEYRDSQSYHREFEIMSYDLMDLVHQLPAGKAELPKVKGLFFYITNGDYLATNLPGFSKNQIVTGKVFEGIGKTGGYLIYQNGEMKKYPESDKSKNLLLKGKDNNLAGKFQYLQDPDSKIYFAFDEDFFKDQEEAYIKARDQVRNLAILMGIAGLIALVSLIWLIVVTGRKDKEGNRPSYRIDNLFSEISLAIVATCFFGGGYLFLDSFQYSVRYSRYDFDLMVRLAATVGVGLVSAAVGLLFLLSIIRNIKAGRFIKTSLTYKVFYAIVKGASDVYHGGSLMRKVVLLTLLVCLLSATVALAPVVAILIIVFAPRWVRKYEKIRTGVSEVKNGNLTYKIPLEGKGELESLAADINEISQASHIAVQNELKNQRMKTELISNVSHDLRTPLTSIITYVDLLKTEGLDSESASQYLDVLEEKSHRLQKLTDDLFDAAKASSGAIPVKFENVDMLSLINQGLGELAPQIEESKLEFIVNADKEKYPVLADGQLLWRVVENLLNNVLKYAMEGSRVYIDLKEIESNADKQANQGQVLVEIKNISKTELNIKPDELMERFKRGDESRTGDGSGLGLAIAKDLVVLQKGWFEIKIDGDLFKAIVMMNKAPEATE